MSYVDDLRNRMRDELDASDRDLDKLETYGPVVIRELTNVYLKTFPLVPQFVEDQMVTLLVDRVREAVDYGRKLVSTHRDMVDMLGSPDTLREAARSIADEVTLASRNLAIEMNPSILSATQESAWSGGASAGYADAFSQQTPAVERVSEYSTVLDDALRSLADAIEQYYIELAIQVTGVVSGILGLVVGILSAVGVVTIPITVVSFIGAAVAFIAAGLSFAAMYLGTLQAVNNTVDELEDKVVVWPPTNFGN